MDACRSSRSVLECLCMKAEKIYVKRMRFDKTAILSGSSYSCRKSAKQWEKTLVIRFGYGTVDKVIGK